MKKTLLAAALSISAFSAAHAATGTITFEGEGTANTCKLSAGQTTDFTVTLPTVSVTDLNAPDKVAGKTPFSILLEECTGVRVGTWFESGATVDTTTGRIINTANNGAKNVQIQLLNSQDKVLSILPGGQTNNNYFAVADDKTVELTYSAQYYANKAAAGAGIVGSTLQYTIVYN